MKRNKAERLKTEVRWSRGEGGHVRDLRLSGDGLEVNEKVGHCKGVGLF